MDESTDEDWVTLPFGHSMTDQAEDADYSNPDNQDIPTSAYGTYVRTSHGLSYVANVSHVRK